MKGFVIGITGGMAAGKSTIAGLLRRKGAACYSVDEAAHFLYRRGSPVWRRLVRAFGRGILASGGSVDRRVLGSLVFRSPAALKTLEKIVHPSLRREAAAAVKRMRRLNRVTVIEAGPLLYRLGLDRKADLVVLARCPRSERLKRLMRSKGLSEGEAARRLGATAFAEALLEGQVARARARVIIDTSAGREKIAGAADRIYLQAENAL